MSRRCRYFPYQKRLPTHSVCRRLPYILRNSRTSPFGTSRLDRILIYGASTVPPGKQDKNIYKGRFPKNRVSRSPGHGGSVQTAENSGFVERNRLLAVQRV